MAGLSSSDIATNYMENVCEWLESLRYHSIISVCFHKQNWDVNSGVVAGN